MLLTFRLGLPGSTKANQGHGPQIRPWANLIHTTPTVDCAKVIKKLAHLRAFVGTHMHTHPLYTLLPTHARVFEAKAQQNSPGMMGSLFTRDKMCVCPPKLEHIIPDADETRLKDCALFRSSPYKNG